MKKSLITGGTGFVGACLARYLIERGWEVHLIVRENHSPWRIEDIRNKLILHRADLRDAEAVARAVKSARADTVFHLAAYGAYSFQRDARSMIETNITGLVNLMEACVEQGFEAFVNAGSSSEYGFKDHPPLESEPTFPNSEYAITKDAATNYCNYTSRELGAPVTTLRLYSVYGPYEEPARLVPALILNGMRNKLPPLVSSESAHDFIHVRDVCRALTVAAESCRPGKTSVYNVGTGVQTSLEALVGLVKKILNVEEEPAWGSMPSRTWDSNVWVADTSLIEAELGWRPALDVEGGILNTVEWFRENPDITRFYYEKVDFDTV